MLADGVAQSKPGKAIDRLITMIFIQELCHQLIGVFTVVVVRIDDHKAAIQQPLTAEQRMAGSPGFFTAFWTHKTAGQIGLILISADHFHTLLHTHLPDAVASQFIEQFFNIMPDNEHYAAETRLNSVVDGIFHQRFTTGPHVLQLLHAALKAGTDTGCHDEKSVFHGCTSLFFQSDKIIIMRHPAYLKMAQHNIALL